MPSYHEPNPIEEVTVDTPKPLTYRSAGVNIDAGNALVDRIKPLARSTYRPGVLGGIGGFGGLFAVPGGYREPVLVSGTDGVGTRPLGFNSSRTLYSDIRHSPDFKFRTEPILP